MTIGHAYKKVSEVMAIIENLNFYEIETRSVRILNQQKLNKAYKVLDDFKAELEREVIKNKQKKEAMEND